jgi:hypothetical protein
MAWKPENTTKDELAKGFELKAKYRIQGKHVLESCSTCHR